MSKWLKDKEEKIQEIISKLAEDSEKGKLIIVEGKKDERVLRELGVNGPIFKLKTCGKSFVETTAEIEKLQANEVILLLDFDRRGIEGTQRLKEDLEHARIKANIRFWQDLRYTVNREIHCIEGLASYLHTLQDRICNS